MVIKENGNVTLNYKHHIFLILKVYGLFNDSEVSMQHGCANFNFRNLMFPEGIELNACHNQMSGPQYRTACYCDEEHQKLCQQPQVFAFSTYCLSCPHIPYQESYHGEIYPACCIIPTFCRRPVRCTHRHNLCSIIKK